ncbi:EB module [compost metagenome]
MKPLLLAVFLMLAGFCNAWAQNCTWDSDCKSGYMCNDGQCRMGKWPDGGCNWDSDCQDGYRCDNNGECRMGKWPDGGCTWDSDCLDGYRCNSGECRMGKWPDGGCNWDSECLEGYECKGGECEAKPDFIGKILVKAGKIQKPTAGCAE